MSTPDYSKYIKNSFELVKKNKWLWIFGALVGTGGGFSFNSGSDITKNLNLKEKAPTDILKNIPQKTAGVLGDSTSSFLESFNQIPPYKWVLFIVLILALVIIGIVVVLIIRNWARGSLIKGVELAGRGETADLKTASPYGFKYLKKLILLSLLLFLVGTLLTVIVPIVWALIFLLIKNIMLLKVLWIIAGIAALLFIFFIGFIMLSLINIYSERLIVLRNMGVIDAFKKSIVISKKAFLPAILMGVINKAIAFVAGIINVIVLGIVIGIPSYLAYTNFETNSSFSIMLITFIAMSFLIFIFAFSVINSALMTFNYANWNQLFNEYMENEKSA